MENLLNEQYLYILSIIERDDYKKVDINQLNAIVNDAINKWKNMAHIYFINDNYLYFSEKFCNDYNYLLANMTRYSFLVYIKNRDNKVAESIYYAMCNAFVKNIDMHTDIENLHKSTAQEKIKTR